MGVPGNPQEKAPAELAATELFAVDAYRRDFEATVVEVDREGRRVRLDRTAFYPGGGGQPCDVGTLTDRRGDVRRRGGQARPRADLAHLDGDGRPARRRTEVHGELDWSAGTR